MDTEGYDLEVLQSNDWTRYRPKFVMVETLEYRRDGLGAKLNHIYDPYFAGLRYVKVADTWINSIYVDKKLAPSLNLKLN